MANVIVITASDGDVRIEKMPEATLLSRLEEQHYGAYPIFLDEVNAASDPNYWSEGSVLVIKGDIAKPRAIQHVTRYSLS
jgi:hypothetical protein